MAFECSSEFSFQIWITFWSNPRILTLTPHTSSPAQKEGEEREREEEGEEEGEEEEGKEREGRREKGEGEGISLVGRGAIQTWVRRVTFCHAV